MLSERREDEEGFCLMWIKRKAIIIIIAKQWGNFPTRRRTTEDFFLQLKEQQWKHGTENFVIIVINSGINQTAWKGENWQYYSLERIYFYFSFFFSAASSASLIWIDSLEKKRKVKANDKNPCYVFSRFPSNSTRRCLPPPPSREREFLGNSPVISFLFLSGLCGSNCFKSLFFSIRFLKRLKNSFLVKTFSGTHSKGK
jgi:hypothetical protein